MGHDRFVIVDEYGLWTPELDSYLKNHIDTFIKPSHTTRVWPDAKFFNNLFNITIEQQKANARFEFDKLDFRYEIPKYHACYHCNGTYCATPGCQFRALRADSRGQNDVGDIFTSTEGKIKWKFETLQKRDVELQKKPNSNGLWIPTVLWK